MLLSFDSYFSSLNWLLSVIIIFTIFRTVLISVHVVFFAICLDMLVCFFFNSEITFHLLSFCHCCQFSFFSSKSALYCSICSFLSIFSNYWLHISIVVLFTCAHDCIAGSILLIIFLIFNPFIKKLLLVL